MFGITNDDIEFIDKKLTFQLQYYEKLDINFSEGKTAKDFIYSANLNPQKYFAEINNRVNTMFLNAKEKGLMPVFCTITAPSKYHNKDIDGNLEISPNETAKVISEIFDHFKTNSYIFRKMKKELDYSLTYFRVYEPHKSGVPHCHLMLFLPPQYILHIKKLFFRFFSSSRFGANVKALDFRYTWHNEGGGATGYIMKYILKSFKDEQSTKVNFAVYWYIKHRVRRFLSSRTLCSLSIYRKIRYYFKHHHKNDLDYITRLVKRGDIYYQFEKDNIFFRFFDPDTGQVEEICLFYKSADAILNRKISQRIKLTYKKILKRTIFSIDNKPFIMKNGKLAPVVSYVIPSKMSNILLYSYYLKLDNDISKVDLKHYGVVKNECITRGLLDGVIMPINAYTTDYDCSLYNDDSLSYFLKC